MYSDLGKSTHVETSLTKVGINGSNAQGMIMVPQSSHGLSIWVVVIFVLPGVSAVLSPAVERSSAVASMKMDGRWSIVFVDESDDCFPSLGHVKGGTWCDAIVPNIGSCSQVWVRLLLERDNVDLIVVDGCSAGARVAGEGIQDRWDWQFKLEDVLVSITYCQHNVHEDARFYALKLTRVTAKGLFQQVLVTQAQWLRVPRTRMQPF